MSPQEKLFEKQCAISTLVTEALEARGVSGSEVYEIGFIINDIISSANNAKDAFYHAAFHQFDGSDNPKVMHELQDELVQVEKDFDAFGYQATREDFLHDHDSPTLPALHAAAAELLKAGWSKDSISAEINYAF